MNLTSITYFTVVAVWIVLFGIRYRQPRKLPQGQRSLAILFFASLISLVAWVTNLIWLSLAGSIVALVAVSLHAPVMNQWFKERFNSWALLLWIVWFTTISLTLAHVFFIYRLLIAT